MTFIKDASFWTRKIKGINRAIEQSKSEVSKLRNQLDDCFDPDEKNSLEFQIESWESQTSSFAKELEAAKVGKFA